MTPPSETTRVLNLVISVLFTVGALGIAMPGLLNLLGAVRAVGNERLRYLAWGLGCLVAAVDVAWLGWRVVPRVFIPQQQGDIRQTGLLLLLGAGIFIAAFAIPAIVNRVAA